jgi:atypical dual specificity phosphatase
MDRNDHETGAAALFEIRRASIKGPDQVLLDHLDLMIPDRAITVLLGPAGTGKSMLLKALSGRPLPAGWRLRGEWRYRGRDLTSSILPVREIAWVPPQVSWSLPGRKKDSQPEREINWREAFRSEAVVLMLDEPTRGATQQEVDELKRALPRRLDRGAVVVVTHDIGFARFIADHVLMICAGRIIADCDAKGFFEHPPNELAAKFILHGNCWPQAPRPELPQHFHWVLKDQLAGMGRPGLTGEVETDLYAIAQAGISLLVSLTEEAVPASVLRPFGIAGRHYPITDMGIPAMGTTASLCRDIQRAIAEGERVAVHCHAGLGRTGTILASVLVWMGQNPDEAVRRLRTIARGYIQTRSQQDFVHRFAEATCLPKSH